MGNAWMVALGLVPVVSVLVRELVALHRYRARRTSIENVVRHLGPGGRVVDRDPDGAVIEVTLDRAVDMSSRGRRGGSAT
ncbi:hypothetical protein SAMN05216188_103272 [Lentzea xinjiangensis]|uniref:Uncharacterized protein n=1 Tax=Lentzea xinjiangensis TaxID=402600 RepID=A0A1H9GLD4_9PSEU|nr:hypothetical protein [Lentzea xinjiangensis]SEQ50915.1 hypothetical protein SAMN05216188_103272 [Lentzea xinjiangensis]